VPKIVEDASGMLTRGTGYFAIAQQAPMMLREASIWMYRTLEIDQ
jgi:hypothetical protein